MVTGADLRARVIKELGLDRDAQIEFWDSGFEEWVLLSSAVSMRGIARVKLRLVRDDVSKADLEAILVKRPSFGLYSIYCTHPGRQTGILALMLLGAQIIIPIALFIRQFRDYNSGWCPNLARPPERILMFGIAMVY